MGSLRLPVRADGFQFQACWYLYVSLFFADYRVQSTLQKASTLSGCQRPPGYLSTLGNPAIVLSVPESILKCTMMMSIQAQAAGERFYVTLRFCSCFDESAHREGSIVAVRRAPQLRERVWSTPGNVHVRVRDTKPWETRDTKKMYVHTRL
jgi:hypothetical protein